MRNGSWVVRGGSPLAAVVIALLGAGCGGREHAETTGAGGSAGHDGGRMDGNGGSDGDGETSTCPALDNPTGGVVSAPDRAPGSMATTTCQLGYALKGPATRTCQAGGTWSDTAATCAIKDCGTLHAPKDGNVSAPQTTFGAIATYSCGAGFGPSGSSTRACQLDGTWSGADPTCVVADCPALPGPVGGVVVAPTLTVGSTATYTCAAGYTLTGTVTRACQMDHSWTGAAPTCAINDCGALKAPVNGASAAAATTYGALAVFTCDPGYALSGAAVISCQADGTWSAAPPTCGARDCGPLTAPANGAVDAPVTSLGASATYTCASGYTLAGVGKRTCQADGTWSDAAPTCTTKTCGALTAPDNGAVDVPSMAFGAVATYSCKPGFGPSGSSTRSCQADGTWTGTEPSCVVANCPALASPAGGTVSAPMLTFGATATYTCNTGYDRTGPATRTCQNDGTWSGAAATCAIKDCGALKDPTNGQVKADASTFGATATYACAAGYALSAAATRMCQADGMWSGSAPTCTIKDCGPLTAPTKGSVVATQTTYMAMATYACVDGYDLSGPATRTCQADGMWSGQPPSCAAKDCGPLTAPANGSVNAPMTTVGSTAMYACMMGYGPSGSSTRTCQTDGKWSGTAPTCVVANCPALAAPTGGAVSAPDLTYNAVARYSCNAGYTLNGAETRTCQANGFWSGMQPTCDPKDCGGLSSPANGTVSTNRQTYGGVATYACNGGYTLTGSTTRTCQSDGTWSASAPTCVAKDCGTLTSPANGSVVISATTVGGTATYSCNTNYTLSGGATRTCQGSGAWSGAAPSCVDICTVGQHGTPSHCCDNTVCGGFVCAASVCKSACAGNADCVTDDFCFASACHADVVSISVSFSGSCAALKDGRVFCWGTPALLGAAATLPSTVPVQVPGITDAVQVRVGVGFACALRSGGTEVCWGQGILGDGTASSNTTRDPVTVVTDSGPLTGIKMIAAGSQGACAGTASNAYCWGTNGFHNLGVDVDTVTKPSGMPTLKASPVVNGSAPLALSMGQDPQPVVATFNGTSICHWGKDGAASSCAAVGSAIAQIAATSGGGLICLRTGTRVLCAGYNDYKQCGSIATSFVEIPGNDIAVQASDVGAYNFFACALGIDANKTVGCWGLQWGDNSVTPSPIWSTPTTIPLSNPPAGVHASALATGGDDAEHICVVASDGSAWCGGHCFTGACGTGTTSSKNDFLEEVHATW